MWNFTFSLYLTFIFLNGLPLFATPPILSFDDFSSENASEDPFLLALKGEVVQLRGFWYPLSPHEGILAPQINLKSCCLKTPSKVQQQLLVKTENDFPVGQRALTVEGIFKIEPLHNVEGQLIQLFVLEDAKVIQQSHLQLYLIIFSILILLFCIYYFFSKMQIGKFIKK